MRRLPPAPARPAPTPRRVRLLVIVKIIAPLSTEALNICPRHVVMPTTRSDEYDAHVNFIRRYTSWMPHATFLQLHKRCYVHLWARNLFELNVFFSFVCALFILVLRKLLCSECDCDFHLICLQYSLEWYEGSRRSDCKRARASGAIRLGERSKKPPRRPNPPLFLL